MKRTRSSEHFNERVTRPKHSHNTIFYENSRHTFACSHLSATVSITIILKPHHVFVARITETNPKCPANFRWKASLTMSTKSDNPPPLSFQDEASNISPLSANQTPTPRLINQPPRKRYVARIKNVCIAIPFNPNETLLSFQKEAISRASTHRKLRNELKLSSRLQYIKLATPHYSQLVDVCILYTP